MELWRHHRRRLAQRSSTDCICRVFHAITMLAKRFSASATAGHPSARLACMLARTRTGVDRPLQCIDRLAAVEHAAQLAAEGLLTK